MTPMRKGVNDMVGVGNLARDLIRAPISRGKITRGPAPWRVAIIVGLVLLGVVLAVYFPVSRAEFLNYDDDTYIVRNIHVTSGISLENLRWALTTSYKANWMPLTWISHQITVQIFGMQPGPHHLVNLALHAANTLLLLFVLRAFTGALWRSAAVAALFAIHPLHVESVAWVAERKDVLSTLFLLLGLLTYRRYVNRPRPVRLLAVAGLLGLGLAAKPMLVTFPALLLLFDFWPLGRMRPGLRGSRRTIGALLFEKLPLFLLAGAAACLTLFAQWGAGAMGSRPGSPDIGMRVANALVSYSTYIAKTLRPVDLAVYYPFPIGGIPAWQVGISTALLISATVASVLLARRAPWFGFGWLWYLSTLVPVIGLVQVGSQAMADRYTYVPLTGVFIISVWAAAEFVPKMRYREVILTGLALAALLPFALLARRQVGLWHDSATLFTHAISAAPGNALAEIKLGDVLAVAKRPQEALAHYRRALEIAPGFPEISFDIGLQLEALGDTAGAATSYNEALRLDPDYSPARVRLGVTFARFGRFEEAFAQYRETLRRSPGNAEVYYHMGVDFTALGRYREAAQAYREALRLDPAVLSARRNLDGLIRRGVAE